MRIPACGVTRKGPLARGEARSDQNAPDAGTQESDQGPRPNAVPRFPAIARTGMILLALLVLTGLAGIPMAFRYNMDPAMTHDAVASLTQGVWGWIRGVHAWAAAFVVGLILLHAGSAWLQRAEARVSPRIWVAGALVLGVILATYLTGTVLRFDHRSWEAIEHIDQAAKVIGISIIETGEPESAPLDWFFILHVFAVPAILVGLLGMHLMRSRRLRHLAVRLRALGKPVVRPAVAGIGVVAVLALSLPPQFGPAPVAGLEVTNPPWPFLWLVPLQDWTGSWILWILPLLVVGVLLAPWITVRWTTGARSVAAAVAAGVLLLLTAIGGGVL